MINSRQSADDIILQALLDYYRGKAYENISSDELREMCQLQERDFQDGVTKLIEKGLVMATNSLGHAALLKITAAGIQIAEMNKARREGSAIIRHTESLADPTTLNENRKKFLKAWDFAFDPFYSTDGAEDQFLLHYYYFPENYQGMIIEQSKSLETFWIFGPPGSGKSSLRSIILANVTGLVDPNLVIEYHDFTPLINKFRAAETVRTEDHLEEMIRAAIQKIFEEIFSLGKVTFQPNNTNFPHRAIFWNYVEKFENDGTFLTDWSDKLGDNPRQLSQISEDPYHQLAGFCRIVKRLFGYKDIYWLVDPDNGIDKNCDNAWKVIEPLLRDRRLFVKPQETGAFKFFLDVALYPFLQRTDWFYQERYPEKDYLPLLRKNGKVLLAERIRLSNKSKVPRPLGAMADGIAIPKLASQFIQQKEDVTQIQDLDDLVVWMANGNLRKLFRICDAILVEKCKQTFDPVDIYINQDQVVAALSLFITQPIPSQAERRIDEKIEHWEDQTTEFKASLRIDIKTGGVQDFVSEEVAITLSSFMNALGGVLILGIDDKTRQVTGLSRDINSLGKKDTEGFRIELGNIIRRYLELTREEFIRKVEFISYKDHLVCWIEVDPGSKPVYCLCKNKHEYYKRIGPQSKLLDTKAAIEDVEARFWKKDIS
jgi:hypothetical protein